MSPILLVEKERRIKSHMVTYLSEQPSVVNRWEKVLINLGLERKKVDVIKATKLDLKEKLNKGLNQWIGLQDEDIDMDQVMAEVADVLKHNNIGLNSTAGRVLLKYSKLKLQTKNHSSWTRPYLH